MSALKANVTLALILSALLGIFGISAKTVEYVSEPVSIGAFKPASATTKDPAMARMVNCEDYDIQPCFTYDEGAWRMVTSYSPYHSIKLVKCTEEDASGKQTLPCIWKNYNKVGKGQPRTKNVFFKS